MDTGNMSEEVISPTLDSDGYSVSSYNSTLGAMDYEFIEINLEGRIYQFFTQPHMIIMLILGFIAITINILSLMALFHIRNRMNSHYRLIVSLSASDLLIGITLLLYIVNKVINPVSVTPSVTSRCTFMVIRALHTTALNMSLLNLMGMSIDHYLAINKPLHYPKLMNQTRVRMMILILWAVAFFCGFLNLITAVLFYGHLNDVYGNYCEVAAKSEFQEEYVMMAIATVCLVVMVVIYTNIYRTVSRHKTPGVTNQAKHDERRRSRRPLITTLLILGSFVVCWIPQCLFNVIMVIGFRINPEGVEHLIVYLAHVNVYLQHLLLLNSICDPIIYTVRTFEVQLGYRRMFASCFKRPYLDRKRSGFNATQSSLLKMPNDANTTSQRIDLKTQKGKQMGVTAL